MDRSDSVSPLLQVSAAAPTRRRCGAATVATIGFAAMFVAMTTTLGRRAMVAGSRSEDMGIVAVETGKVQVELYGMAGCPFTRAFIEGPLTETLTTVPELFDFKFIAFGNSYWITDECGGSAEGMKYASYNKGYNQSVRSCFNYYCGAAAEATNQECFKGDLVCQHGKTDGMVTAAWNCAQHMTQNDAAAYWPFVTCSALKFLAITSDHEYRNIIGSCARAAGLNADNLLQCALGDEGNALMQAAARATVPHPSVPYALVDGVVLDDTACVACGDGIIQHVCDAVKARGGGEVPLCQGIYGEI